VTRRSSGRRRARELALRVLYQADINDEGIPAAAAAVLRPGADPPAVVDFARAIVEAVHARRDAIDSRIAAAARNWTLQRMASIDRNVLRLATAELMAFEDVDARVIIDEAISIARRFGTDDSGRFVNGVLDVIARDLRPDELERG
jgi:N utilization substance protein B